MAVDEVDLGWYTQLTTETRPWTIDLVDAMDVGDILQSVTSTLTDLLNGADFPLGLDGTPAGAGTSVTQAVTGLIAGHNYRLVISADMGGSKVTSTALKLACPY